MLNAPQVKPACLPSLQANIHNVGIHYMSPGMVNTGLLMAGPHSAVTKMFINCLGREAGAGPRGRGEAYSCPNCTSPLAHPLLLSSPFAPSLLLRILPRPLPPQNSPSPPFPPAADSAEEVAAFLVPRLRRVPEDSVSPLTGSIAASYLMYLTNVKAFTQIFLVSVGLMFGGKWGPDRPYNRIPVCKSQNAVAGAYPDPIAKINTDPHCVAGSLLDRDMGALLVHSQSAMPLTFPDPP